MSRCDEYWLSYLARLRMIVTLTSCGGQRWTGWMTSLRTSVTSVAPNTFRSTVTILLRPIIWSDPHAPCSYLCQRIDRAIITFAKHITIDFVPLCSFYWIQCFRMKLSSKEAFIVHYFITSSALHRINPHCPCRPVTSQVYCDKCSLPIHQLPLLLVQNVLYVYQRPHGYCRISQGTI